MKTIDLQKVVNSFEEILEMAADDVFQYGGSVAVEEDEEITKARIILEELKSML